MSDLFRSLDRDNSGTLSREELLEGLGIVYGTEIEDI